MSSEVEGGGKWFTARQDGTCVSADVLGYNIGSTEYASVVELASMAGLTIREVGGMAIVYGQNGGIIIGPFYAYTDLPRISTCSTIDTVELLNPSCEILTAEQKVELWTEAMAIKLEIENRAMVEDLAIEIQSTDGYIASKRLTNEVRNIERWIAELGRFSVIADIDFDKQIEALYVRLNEVGERVEQLQETTRQEIDYDGRLARIMEHTAEPYDGFPSITSLLAACCNPSDIAEEKSEPLIGMPSPASGWPSWVAEQGI